MKSKTIVDVAILFLAAVLLMGLLVTLIPAELVAPAVWLWLAALGAIVVYFMFTE